MMAHWLVDKTEEARRERLTPEESRATRGLAAGTKDEALRQAAAGVIRRARSNGLWLECDCRDEDGVGPYLSPCHDTVRELLYWRPLPPPRLQHAPACNFRHLPRQASGDAGRVSHRKPAAEELFAVLSADAEAEAVSGERRQSEDGGGGGPPALRTQLYRLIESAGLNRLRPPQVPGGSGSWSKQLEASTAGFSIAPGRPLSALWFPRFRSWRSRRVHARVREAARRWPEGHEPQGFLCWYVWEVDADGAGRKGHEDRVEVLSGLRRPIVHRKPVERPWLFIGAVGRTGGGGYECIEGYAQPVYWKDLPVPVDSHYERQALRTLRSTLGILDREFPDAEFELEKPLFDIDTPEGPCIPDFMIRARRGDDELTFVIEVMGFERPDYLKGKEITHPRMERLGTMCEMRGDKFGPSIGGATNEGRKVTNTMRNVLRSRWKT